MKSRIIILAIIAGTLCMSISCERQTNENNGITPKYPNSKIWAHKANDTTIAKCKRIFFDGLEVDAMYSEASDILYVGHDECDTINKLTLDQWFSSLQNPHNTYYWVDMKNLNESNADKILIAFNAIAQKYGIKDVMYIESPYYKALKTLKNDSFNVILWVDNLYSKEMDTTTWFNLTKSRIEYLSPDAISCDAGMFSMLTGYFPEQNIHLWQTPADYSEANAEITRKLCRNKSVKVVLVDYNKPISY